MANMYINDMSEVWTSIGTSYSAIKMNVTNAASMTTPTISKLLHLQVGGSDKFTVDKNGGAVAAATVTAAGFVSATAPLPVTNDGAGLGSAAQAWSDLYLATGGVINWNNADVTITHAPETLIFAGASDGYWFDSALRPVTADLAPLGTSARPWSDLYLASGGVIDWANGDITLTHSGNTLTLSGGTFTSNGAISAFSTITAGGPITAASFSTAGTITATGVITGGTLTTGGNLNCSAAIANSAYFIGATTAAVLGTNLPSSAGHVYLRPNGYNSGTNQGYMRHDGYFVAPIVYGSTSLVTPGTLSVSSTATIGGQIHCAGSVFHSTIAQCILSASGGNIYFRPNGINSAVEQVYINTNGTLVTDPTTTGIIVNKPTTSTSYAILAYGNVSSGAVRGYCNNTAYYGILGYQTGGVAYSFYGSGQAQNTTSWDVSDMRAKHDIIDCDCTDAYSKVRSIVVKSYLKRSSAKDTHPLPEIGWLAQEIEKVIPEAVMDVGIPEDDTATRDMVGGDTIKSTNDRTMLATLWAAFQHQTHLIEALEAKVTALEAKGT